MPLPASDFLAATLTGTKFASRSRLATQLRRHRPAYSIRGAGMADRNALGMIGLMLGAATMFVTVIGAVVVGNYAGPLHAQNATATVATLPTASR
jgi:hypothetical protein